MSRPGRSALGMCCGFFFLWINDFPGEISLLKGSFSAILRCWVVYPSPCPEKGLTAWYVTPKIKVLKGIPSVDDPFGARWSA
jgi:hypothetical protein